MEVKKRRVLLRTIEAVVVLCVLAFSFWLSPWAGITAIVFGIAGVAKGYFCRQNKLQEKFINHLMTTEPDLLSGKMITITADDYTGNVSVQVTEPKKKEKRKKKKEVVED